MSDKFANQIRNMAHEIVMEETKSMRNQLTAITAERDRLQNQVDCAKVSLDKFFDTEYSGDLCNQAVEVREMYCKLGDENDRLRAALEEIERRICAGYRGGSQTVLDIARTALKEEG
jgi:uncharacterized coiled-coil DUF342 family protein